MGGILLLVWRLLTRHLADFLFRTLFALLLRGNPFVFLLLLLLWPHCFKFSAEEGGEEERGLRAGPALVSPPEPQLQTKFLKF